MCSFDIGYCCGITGIPDIDVPRLRAYPADIKIILRIVVVGIKDWGSYSLFGKVFPLYIGTTFRVCLYELLCRVAPVQFIAHYSLGTQFRKGRKAIRDVDKEKKNKPVTE